MFFSSHPRSWMEKISDFDPRIVYLPNVAAPQDCATNADNEDCNSRWWTQDTSSAISLHTSWGPDTSCEFSFTGGAVRMYGTTSSAGAVARASVDRHPGVIVNFASQDGETHNNQLLLNLTGFDAGQPHTLKLSYDKGSYGSAPGRKLINIDWFEVTTAVTSDSQSSLSSTTSTSSSQDSTPKSIITETSSVIVTHIVQSSASASFASHSLQPSTSTSQPLSPSAMDDVSETYSTPVSVTQAPAPSLPLHSQQGVDATSSHSSIKIIVPAVVAPMAIVVMLLILVIWHRSRCATRRLALAAEAEAVRAQTIRPYTVAMSTGGSGSNRVQSKITSLRSMSSNPNYGHPVAIMSSNSCDEHPIAFSARNSIDSGLTKVEH